MNDDNNIDSVLNELASISADPPHKRIVCERCSRPVNVCWCSYLASNPIETKSKLVILQHPSEEKRCLRTAKILELSLSSSQCLIIKGKRFTSYKYPQLSEIFSKPERSLLMYPGVGSIPMESLSNDRPYNIIIIDGTWSQAKSIYHNSGEIQNLQKIELKCNTSNYVIRTQPTELSLSTVEAAAFILAHVENDKSIYKKLTAPLHALCSFQLQHGAVTHHSKEFLIMNGLYKKATNNNNNNKCIKEKLEHEEVAN